MAGSTQQALLQMLCNSTGRELQLEDFMLAHCSRVAEVTSPASDDEVMELTELLNNLLLQSSLEQHACRNLPGLTAQQVQTWLQQPQQQQLQQQQRQGERVAVAAPRVHAVGTGEEGPATATAPKRTGEKGPATATATAPATDGVQNSHTAPVSTGSTLKADATAFVPSSMLTAKPSNLTASRSAAASSSASDSHADRASTAAASSSASGFERARLNNPASCMPPPGSVLLPAQPAEYARHARDMLDKHADSVNMQLAYAEDAFVTQHGWGAGFAQRADADCCQELGASIEHGEEVTAGAGLWQGQYEQQLDYHPASHWDHSNAGQDAEGQYEDWCDGAGQSDGHQYDVWYGQGEGSYQYQEHDGDDRQQRGGDTAEALQLLAAMFPMYGTDILSHLLQMHAGNMHACVTEVLKLEEASYSHDVIDSAPKNEAVALDDDQAFPSLGHVAAAQPVRVSGSVADVHADNQKMTMSATDSVWPHQQVSTPGSWAAIARKLDGNSKAHAGSPAAAGSSGARRFPAAGASTTSAARTGSARHGVVVPRVATGAMLTAQYTAARADARQWAIARNKCFEQATRAFRAGNKALAKELSAQGRAYAERMWEAHEAAASDLLESRRAVQQGDKGGPVTIDLHGLHVQEAVSLVAQCVEDVPATSNGRHCLRLVVGVGKHNTATRGRPRLLGAVWDQLEQMGLQVREVEAGLLEATW